MVRARRPVAIGPELSEELRRPPAWMYPWALGDGSTAPVLMPELPSIHNTRAAIIEPIVREALQAAGPDATALDLGCHEGWFAQRLLDWGANRVVAIDVRPSNIRRAALIRDHYGISAEQLDLHTASVYDSHLHELGRFDVVLCLGLIYHLENPVGALRVAAAMTRGICVVESQLTEQTEPIVHGWGAVDYYEHAVESWAARYEPDVHQRDDGHSVASHGGVISMIPNRAAMLQAMTAAGLRCVSALPAPAGMNKQYVDGHRLCASGRTSLEPIGIDDCDGRDGTQ